MNMIDIDEILAAAIRTVWLRTGAPTSQPAGFHIEIERARRVRAALEQEGVVFIRECLNGFSQLLQSVFGQSRMTPSAGLA